MDKYVSRYHKFYNQVVVPKLMKELEIGMHCSESYSEEETKKILGL